MKKILFFLLFLGCISYIHAQNITVRRLKADSIYILKSSNLLSDTVIVISKGKMYWRVLSDTAFIPTWVDSCGYADSAAVAGLCDSAAVSGNSWQLMGKDTTEIYIGAAGQTGQCITAKKDTVQGCSQDWVNIDDSLHVMGILDLDSILSIDRIRVLYQNSKLGVNSIYGGEGSGINSAGSENTAFGYMSLNTNTNGNSNTSLGAYSLRNNTGGGINVAVGHSSLSDNNFGTANTAIGYDAGNAATGNYCIYVGASAGLNITDSLDYRLFISSVQHLTQKQDSTRSIIYGKQNTDSTLQHLWLNANVHIGGNYVLPFTDSIAGKVLTTNGSGKVYWGNGGSGFDTTECHNLFLHSVTACSDLLIKGGLIDSVNLGGASNSFIVNSANFHNYILNGTHIDINKRTHIVNAVYDTAGFVSTLTGTFRTIGDGWNSTPVTGAIFKTTDSTLAAMVTVKNSLVTGIRVDSAGRIYAVNSDRASIDINTVDDSVQLVHNSLLGSSPIPHYGFFKSGPSGHYFNGILRGGYSNYPSLFWWSPSYGRYSTVRAGEAASGKGVAKFMTYNSDDTTTNEFSMDHLLGITYSFSGPATSFSTFEQFRVDRDGNLKMRNDTVNGTSNLVVGRDHNVVGAQCVVGGSGNKDTGNYNILVGSGLTSKSQSTANFGFGGFIGYASDYSLSAGYSNRADTSSSSLNAGNSNYLKFAYNSANFGTLDSVIGTGLPGIGAVENSTNICGTGNKTAASNSASMGTNCKNLASTSFAGGEGIVIDGIGFGSANFGFGKTDTLYGDNLVALGGNGNKLSASNSAIICGTGLINSRNNTVMVPDLHVTGFKINSIVDTVAILDADTSLSPAKSVIKIISGEAGNVDLDTIISTLPEGTELMLISCSDVKTVTVATGGNIDVGAAPIVLGARDILKFMLIGELWTKTGYEDN